MRRTRRAARIGATLALGAIAAVLLFGGILGGPGEERLPDFGAPTLDGDTLRLADLHGEVALVNLWATWCRPCVREMPALERLHRELSPQGLRVVGINVDRLPPGHPTGAIRDFADGLGVTFPVLLDPRGDSERLFGVFGLPTTFLIGRDGRVLYRHVGEAAWDEPPYRDRVADALGG